MKDCCQRFTGGWEAQFIRRFEALTLVFERAPDGNIVELGVASGFSFRVWGHLLQHHRTHGILYGFDTFAGIPALLPEDGEESIPIGKRKGGDVELRPKPISYDLVKASTDGARDSDGWKIGYGIVEGRIEDTLSRFAPDSLALGFFDCDLYSPTKVGLEILWPRLVPGGILVFDEYGHEAWPGETKAVDDFVAANGLTLLRLPPIPYGPTAALVKLDPKSGGRQ